jgi:hypothetical protein
MKITAYFGNSFFILLYTAALLAIGWVIGVRWGHLLPASWTLLLATMFLLLHDATIAILLAIAATKD